MKAALFAVLTKLGPAVEAGRAKLGELKAAGYFPDKEAVALAIQAKLKDWSPEVKGVAVLDETDKFHLSQALAGLVLKIPATED